MGSLISIVASFALLCCLTTSFAFGAITPTETTDKSNSFVNHLESQYNKLMETQKVGDLARYKALRTRTILHKQESWLKASNEMAKFSQILQQTAVYYPAVKEYRFLKCDATPKVARLAYSKPAQPDAVKERTEFLFIMFELEDGSWKVGQAITVVLPKFAKDRTMTTLKEAVDDQSVKEIVQLSK